LQCARVFGLQTYGQMPLISLWGFERLTSLVQEKMSARIIDGDLFVFFGRSRTRVKEIF
jgi:hypothetical protein